MATVTVAWFGDVVGEPGRRAFREGARAARESEGAGLVVVNGENARHGRGIHPDGHAELIAAGADAITLGDHYADDERTESMLRDPASRLARPANAPAPDGTAWRVALEPEGAPRLVVVPILGRVFMRDADAESPFDALDRVAADVGRDDPDALLLVEVHAEATSEKIALTAYGAERHAGRVVAVVGTHTHVATADERLVGGGVAAVTDLGMCGASGGVIGFDASSSVRRFRGEEPVSLRVASGPVRAEGCVIGIDAAARRAVSIRRVAVDA